jgi:hypothetical protein
LLSAPLEAHPDKGRERENKNEIFRVCFLNFFFGRGFVAFRARDRKKKKFLFYFILTENYTSNEPLSD